MKDNQRKAMFARLRQSGFTPLSSKYLMKKASGEEVYVGKAVYEHPQYGRLMTNMNINQLNEKYGDGWKRVK